MKKAALAAFIYFFVFSTILLGSLLILFLILFRVPRKKAFFSVSRSWAKAILKLSGIKVYVRGLENLNVKGPKVLICNHQGNFDIPILIATLPVDFRFLVKKELFSIPFFGWCLRSRGDVPIDRRNAARASQTLKDLSKNMEDNAPILIFPEGTRSLDGKVQEFKRGSVVIAAECGAKIIPIGISGSFAIQKRGAFEVNPSSVSVNIGEPVDAVCDDGDIFRLPRELREKVISLIGNY